jgi:hypothetical protein
VGRHTSASAEDIASNIDELEQLLMERILLVMKMN